MEEREKGRKEGRERGGKVRALPVRTVWCSTQGAGSAHLVLAQGRTELGNLSCGGHVTNVWESQH